MSALYRSGVALLGVISVIGLTTALFTDGQHPPLIIAIIGAALDVIGIVLAVLAWRGRTWRGRRPLCGASAVGTDGRTSVLCRRSAWADHGGCRHLHRLHDRRRRAHAGRLAAASPGERMTATAQSAQPQAAAQPGSLGRVPRLGGALALVLAPWGFVIANASYAWMIRNGGNDETGAGALALAASGPDLLRLGIVAGMVGCLLIIPAVLTAFRVAPGSRLAFVGGSLMIAGYVCYFGVLLSNMVIITMAQRGGPLADYAAVIDASQSDASTGWVFPIFIVGNLLGTLLFAIGLLRSRTVPIWAAILIMLWPPLHIAGLFLGGEVLEVIGAVLQAIGFAGVAAALLRRSPSGLAP